MKLKGKIHIFGDNIDTDAIIPARYLNTDDPAELAKHCMEDADKDFVSKVEAGDIIAAGKNFGCGSSREHAPIAIKHAGVACVVARSFARIFYRNSINVGFPIFECDGLFNEATAGDIIEIDAVKGEIVNITTGKKYTSEPFPQFIQDIINAGGEIEYVKKKLLDKSTLV